MRTEPAARSLDRLVIKVMHSSDERTLGQRRAVGACGEVVGRLGSRVEQDASSVVPGVGVESCVGRFRTHVIIVNVMHLSD
jgi:hypothetical protein